MEDGRRRPGVEDCISSLPDELLHEILRRLLSAPAAARTSALSRRWRRVWTHIPDLFFGDDLIRDVEAGGASFLDAVDAALAAYSDDRAVHVDSLEIILPPRCGENVPVSRVARWLRFASQRLAGAFLLSVPCQPQPWLPVNREDDELEFPPCEGVTKIELRLGTRFFLRIPPGGMFGSLADLQIYQTTMDGRELGVIFSSSHWPRLQNLTLCVKLVTASDISVRSASLRCLKFHVLNTRRLDVAAPMLEILHASNAAEARIAAPNLAVVILSDILAQAVVADAGRHLRLLEVTRCSAMASLMRRFDSVNKLLLQNPNADYNTFLGCTRNLPKCEILWVSSSVLHNHAFEPSLMHVLRRCNSTRKLILFFLYPSMDPYCSLDCPCRSPESPMTNKIILDSLQEIEIHTFGGSAVKADKFVELLKQLLASMWRKTKLIMLKSVEMNMYFHDSSLSYEQCKKIRGMCPPNIRIKSNVFPEGIAKDVSNPTATSQEMARSEDETQPMKRNRRPSTRYPPAAWTR